MFTIHRELLDTILGVIRERYADDISLMLIYGSCVNGTAHGKSDLDMLFIPSTERGMGLAQTFILDGIGFDLWGTDWALLERFANFDDMRVSVLAESRLVYAASEADRARYDALVARAKGIEAGGLTEALVQKAEAQLRKAKEYLGELYTGCNLSAAGGILYRVMDVICLLNHTYLRYGTKKCVEEMAAFEKLPQGFIELFCAVAEIRSAEEVRGACTALVKLVEAFLHEMKRDTVPRMPAAAFTGLYEELVSQWIKLHNACENGARIQAFLSGTSLQSALDGVVACSSLEAPAVNLMDRYRADDLPAFLAAAEAAREAVRGFLRDNRVPVACFSSISELRASLLET